MGIRVPLQTHARTARGDPGYPLSPTVAPATSQWRVGGVAAASHRRCATRCTPFVTTDYMQRPLRSGSGPGSKAYRHPVDGRLPSSARRCGVKGASGLEFSQASSEGVSISPNACMNPMMALSTTSATPVAMKPPLLRVALMLSLFREADRRPGRTSSSGTSDQP
jgi:hypothetical protein